MKGISRYRLELNGLQFSNENTLMDELLYFNKAFYSKGRSISSESQLRTSVLYKYICVQ